MEIASLLRRVLFSSVACLAVPHFFLIISYFRKKVIEYTKCWAYIILIHVSCILCYFVLWPTNAQ